MDAKFVLVSACYQSLREARTENRHEFADVKNLHVLWDVGWDVVTDTSLDTQPAKKSSRY